VPGLAALPRRSAPFGEGAKTLLPIFPTQHSHRNRILLAPRLALGPVAGAEHDLLRRGQSRRAIGEECLAERDRGLQGLAWLRDPVDQTEPVKKFGFQGVIGASATGWGAVLIPLMLGWALSSLVVGQAVTRMGRSRVWPIVGIVMSLVGFVLLARLDARATTFDVTLCMVIIGWGMAQALQTYVVAMQNSVPQSELGAATASLQFFRTIGAMFGTAAFGALLMWRLTAEMSSRTDSGGAHVGRRQNGASRSGGHRGDAERAGERAANGVSGGPPADGDRPRGGGAPEG